jgi:hypothetical protein
VKKTSIAITAANPSDGKPILATYACCVSVQRSPLMTFIDMLDVSTLISLVYVEIATLVKGSFETLTQS